jgi:hypothetical protein
MTYKSIKKLKLWLIKGIKFKIPTGHSKYKGRPCCNGVTSHKVLFHGDSLTISPNCDIRDVARGSAVCVLGQREPIPADLGPMVSDIPCFCLVCTWIEQIQLIWPNSLNPINKNWVGSEINEFIQCCNEWLFYWTQSRVSYVVWILVLTKPNSVRLTYTPTFFFL